MYSTLAETPRLSADSRRHGIEQKEIRVDERGDSKIRPVEKKQVSRRNNTIIILIKNILLSLPTDQNDITENRREFARILGRRYSLTKTGYKYLDVGITARQPSTVEILIGDWHGKKISLSPETWKELVNQTSYYRVYKTRTRRRDFRRRCT